PMGRPGDWGTIRAGCEAHLLLGQYEEAIATCEKAAGRAGEVFDIAYFLAAAYAHTGATARAAEETAKILRRSPGFTIAKLRSKGYSTNPEYMRLAEAHWPRCAPRSRFSAIWQRVTSSIPPTIASSTGSESILATSWLTRTTSRATASTLRRDSNRWRNPVASACRAPCASNCTARWIW